MPKPPTAALVAAGLVGGFVAARSTGRRELGGAIFGVLGLLACRQALPRAGAGGTAALAGVYVAAMGGSHPLAKKIGAWPAVAIATTAAAGTAYAVADRPAR